MTQSMKIDFVSDISCPWCAIGLHALEKALERIGDGVRADLWFHPFELNPDMGPEGEDIDAHLAGKYGATPEQSQQTREAIRARGEEVGFRFNMDRRGRIYNTFDAHRLLAWAGEEGRQRELQHGLFSAYFTQGENPGDHALLTRLAGEAGLDPARAAEILASNAYAAETREAEKFYLEQGIRSVPAVIINDRYLVSGGQPVEVFEQALRQVLLEA